jgi:hypothetical protein
VLPGLPNLAKDRVVTRRGFSDEYIINSAHGPYVPQPGGIGGRGVVGTILRRIKVVTNQTLDTVVIVDVFTVRQMVQLWIGGVDCRVSNIYREVIGGGGGSGEVVVGADGVNVSAVVAEAVVRGWGLRGRRGRRLCECD